MHCGLGPFASPRAGAILSLVFCFFAFLPPIFTSLCPGTGLGLSARFQLPYTIFSWPFQQIKGFASGPLVTQCGAIPAPESLRMLILRPGSRGCRVSDGLSSISLLRLHSSFLFILWVASCHACFDIPPPHLSLP